MRSKSLPLATAALLLLALTASHAHAQVGPRIPPQYGVGSRPTLSPYLNLLRGGDLSANYFLGVQPEFQRRADQSTMLTRTRELDQRTNEIEDELEQPVQGTAADFGSTGNYFTSPNTYFNKVTPAGPITQGRPPSRQRGIR